MEALEDEPSVGKIPTRRCMVCRKDLMKGFFRHRTDPICLSCISDVQQQRSLLTKKFKAQDAAKRYAEGKKVRPEFGELRKHNKRVEQ